VIPAFIDLSRKQKSSIQKRSIAHLTDRERDSSHTIQDSIGYARLNSGNPHLNFTKGTIINERQRE
jgi:hypothetical protein